MCKFTIVYKLTTAMTAKAMDKNEEVGAKVKSSSGAYGMLEGITEQDMQAITDKVAKNFIERMKNEGGVNIYTWSQFKDSKNTDMIIEAQEERELYSKSQGLAFAMSHDGTPNYNRVIIYVPGGKKLAKEIGKNVMEFTIYIDFADVLAEANADVSITGRSETATTKTTHYTWSEGGNQKLVPGVRIVRNIGSESLGEMGKNLSTTKIGGHDDLGYMFYTGLGAELVSDVNFVEKIVEDEGKVPDILTNRKNNKIEYAKTFKVVTTPAKYEAAVLDVTNKYFDAFLKIYKFHAAK